MLGSRKPFGFGAEKRDLATFPDQKDKIRSNCGRIIDSLGTFTNSGEKAKAGSFRPIN
jgi:hypothetical protein